MILSGEWDDRTDRVVHMLEPAERKFMTAVDEMADENLKKATKQLYTSVIATTDTILYLCKTKAPCSSQAVAALMRTLVEACVSVFAFCKDPAARAPLYLEHAYVVQFRLLPVALAYVGGSGGTPAMQELLEARDEIQAFLIENGTKYLGPRRVKESRTPEETVRDAIENGKSRRFRQQWFPETRSELLQSLRMFVTDDALYPLLCSAVHSDACAALVLGGFNCSEVASMAVEFWAAALLGLVESLGIDLPARLKGGLRKLRAKLQSHKKA